MWNKYFGRQSEQWGLFRYRFEIFITTLLLLLFGSLVIPEQLMSTVIHPLLLLLNILAGILLISKNEKLFWFFIMLFAAASVCFGFSFFLRHDSISNELTRMMIYFVFYLFVTVNIIRQVWNATFVSRNVIIGLMCGYICLGLMSFFTFMTIEMVNPGSFKGLLLTGEGLSGKMDSLLYYSFITLLTIGYGEIIPATPIAQKAAILTGLVGQFYIVVITAVVVEKYILHSQRLS